MGKTDVWERIALLAMLRAQAYRWFQTALGYEPCADVVAWLGSDEAASALDAATCGDTEAQASWTRVRGALAAAHAGGRDGVPPDAVLADLARAYTRLFVGPEALSVKPWESSWLGGDESLFQESTLEVRRTYLAEGFLAQGYPHIADDHVAIELDFMAALADELVAAVERVDAAEALRFVDVSQRFLHAHLLRWVLRYARALSSESPQGGFYADVVHLAHRFLTLDERLLVEAKGALGNCRGEHADGQGNGGATG
jgi:putative dimethyl sulfoxide reductase chaperone